MGRVEIFHDSEYLRNVKEAKLLSANPRRRHSSRSKRTKSTHHHQRQEPERPRSLVLQKVEQDDSRHHRVRKSHSQDLRNHQKQELEDDRMMVEDARKALVKERLELELLRRQMERKK